MGSVSGDETEQYANELLKLTRRAPFSISWVAEPHDPSYIHFSA